MTLGELIAAYRTDADDTANPPFCGDAELTALFNEAEVEACIRARLIFDNSPSRCRISLDAGVASYAVNELLHEISYAAATAADGTTYVLTASSRYEQDAQSPAWRTEADRPRAYIHDDKTLTIAPLPDAAYTLNIEGYRLPTTPMASVADSPEIHAQHHRQLVHWVMYRAYSKPDGETLNKGKAADAEARFERYFGPRPNASIRRKQLANRPHHNKPIW